MGLIANPSPLSFSTLLNVNLVCIVFYTDKVKKGTKACSKSALFLLRGTASVVQKITFLSAMSLPRTSKDLNSCHLSFSIETKS